MRRCNANTSIVDRGVNTFASILKGLETNDSGKPDKERWDNPKSKTPKWRKLVRTLRDITSIGSLLVSLFRFLQELGVL